MLLTPNSDYMVYILTASSKFPLIRSLSKAHTIGHYVDVNTKYIAHIKSRII